MANTGDFGTCIEDLDIYSDTDWANCKKTRKDLHDRELLEVFKFFGIKLNMSVYLDSSAASGFFQTQGCGQTRQLAVKSLWARS